MPIYVVNPMHAMRENPLAYDETPVIMVGKPRRRLIRARTPGKPGRRSERMTLPSSETHALNPKTGAAFCGAGVSRSTGKAVAGMIHPTNKNVVTCMRCIKIINLNDVDMSVPGVSRRRAIIERDLKPGSAKKREKHQMIRGGEQGRFVSGSGAHVASRKAYRIHKERTPETGGPLFRGSEGIADFEKYVGWRGRPTQTIGEKRGRILEAQRTAAERRRRETAEAAYAESGMAERIAAMGEYAPVEFEEREVMFAEGRRRAAAAEGRRGAAAARREAEAARVAGVAAGRRAVGGAEEYMDNPRRNPSLRKMASKMVKAKKASEVESLYVYEGDTGYYVKIIFRTSAQARDAATDLYLHADWEQYRTEVQTSEPRSAAAAKALAKAVAKDLRFPVADIGTHASRKGAASRSAGLKKGQSLMQKAAAAYRAGKYPTMQAALRGVARKNPLSEDGRVVSNPKRGSKKRSSARTAAQSDAAKAMSLFRSGRADSLGEAWAMVRRGA